MKDTDAALRAARAQAAVMRTLATEMQREGRPNEDTEALQAQALEESARLVSAVGDLSRTRGSTPDTQRESPSRRGDHRRPLVLVVEDDEVTRKGIALGLAPDYDVVVASNGVEGLQAASERTFDAIVADMGMPEMDGVTMVDRIRRLHAPAVIPVVFLTAETAPERIAAGFSAGGMSYLAKPVDLELLDQELRWALTVPFG